MWSILTLNLLFAGPFVAEAIARASLDTEPSCARAECSTVSPEFDHWHRARRIRYGYGMTARADQALRWYGKAAREGDARAMHNFGLMLVRGQGTEPDVATGIKWLYRSFGRGMSESALALGNMARQGTGMARDHRKARAFYLAGAEKGDGRAMHALGNLHVSGLAGGRDDLEAYFWFFLAADRGLPESERAMRMIGDRTPPPVRARVEARARDWLAERVSK